MKSIRLIPQVPLIQLVSAHLESAHRETVMMGAKDTADRTL